MATKKKPDEPLEVEAEIIEDQKTEIVVDYTPASIAANFDALEKYIDEQLKDYLGTEVDIDDDKKVSEARKFCTQLNKMKEPIDKRRKEIERQYKKPLDDFKNRVERITGKIEAARLDIKNQVDEADRIFAEKRKAHMMEEYEGVAGDLCKVVPYSAIEDTKWYTRSCTLKNAEEALAGKCEQILVDRDYIKNKNLEYPMEADAAYCRTLDRAAAFAENDRLVHEAEAVKAHEEAVRELEAKHAQEAPAPVAEEIAETHPHTPQASCVSNDCIAQTAPSETAPVPSPAGGRYRFPTDDPMPCIMIIDAATSAQKIEIGKIVGSVGVTGVMKSGTLAEVALRDDSCMAAFMQHVFPQREPEPTYQQAPAPVYAPSPMPIPEPYYQVPPEVHHV